MSIPPNIRTSYQIQVETNGAWVTLYTCQEFSNPELACRYIESQRDAGELRNVNLRVVQIPVYAIYSRY